MNASYVYALYDLPDLKPNDHLIIYQSSIRQKYEAGAFPAGAASSEFTAVKLGICDRSNRQLASVALHEGARGVISYPEIDIEPDDTVDEATIVARLLQAAMLTARFQGYAYLVADKELDEFTRTFGLRSTSYDFDTALSINERMQTHQENADLVLPLGGFEPSIRPIEIESDAGTIEIRVPYASERLLLVEWVAANFGRGWASEVECAFSTPARPTVVVAMFKRDTFDTPEEHIAGFVTFDTSALGLSTAIAVRKDLRNLAVALGIGQRLGEEMAARGYRYAFLGGVARARIIPLRAYPQAHAVPGSDPGFFGRSVRS